MAQHKKGDEASRQRMEALDDPTAAFPIGALGQLANALDQSEEDELGPDGVEPLSDEDTDAPGSAPHAVRAGYLVLSLVGGGLAAVVLGLLIVVVAVMLQSR